MDMAFLNRLVGFDLKTRMIGLDALLPSKRMPEGAMTSRKFQQIKASIVEIGLIEPLSVARPDVLKDEFLLLDGHMRVLALRELGESEAPCLIAADDETYTYNNRINRLSTIQEHYMLRRAVDRGVSKERLARAFNLDITSIDKRMNLLEGVTAGAVVLLRDQQFNPEVARVLRKMRPERQVEAVELMIAANAITVNYAEALLNATPPEQLADNQRPPRSKPKVTPKQMAKLEREMGKVQGQYQQAEQTYGADLLHLVVAKGYLTKLLGNEAVRRYLTQHQPEILGEFQALVETVALDSATSEMSNQGETEESGEEEGEGDISAAADHSQVQTAEIVSIAAAA
ncbi:MAG: ParB N-terminal domain-containing protein [Proteobacteria bacterium]|nr:ParB N-terminal domain-containing protein [Pseudomonadota bacterium]